jgi:hypothetical protein
MLLNVGMSEGSIIFKVIAQCHEIRVWAKTFTNLSMRWARSFKRLEFVYANSFALNALNTLPAGVREW